MKKVTEKKLTLGKIKLASLTSEKQTQLKGGVGYSQPPLSCIPYSEWRTCWCV
ncbi:MAG TPA: class I lanthipeptide [Chitinophaga sp.]|uniref:class I lanthipeptide n=1 Tax=Chitinophaga sp. TaxID=1869181 RepID=UPI002C32FA91|nr:class I lanthipeptide [Chitinophaga sp.]HVI48734.1 class I lanthipeptide [Chitinophaga sp.]